MTETQRTSSRPVERHAIERIDSARRSDAQPLAQWRDVDAYVLLGEPGAGKTTAFRMEAQASGGEYITARDFVTLGPGLLSGSTLFIDGLDEIRAGQMSTREPLEAVRAQLNTVGRPRFRLSCREADWLGAVDKNALQTVAPSGSIAELHLTALSDADILFILEQQPDLSTSPIDFLAQAKAHGVRDLVGNPLLLRLMADAVRGNQWPSGRSNLYELACERLAAEYNVEHRAEVKRAIASGVVLDSAGVLFALLLLSGSDGFDFTAGSTRHSTVTLDSLPKTLCTPDALAAISRNLFIAEGELRIPLHRTIAEYLAAKTIADRVRQGVPIGRVLAMLCGMDGGVVEPVRGLHAWLSVHCISQRSLLIDRDPLGVVLYGDLTTFGSNDKQRVLTALQREARRFPWFRSGHWDEHPFGALATGDMVATFADLFESPERSASHQSLLDCVLDAIKHTRAAAEMAPLVTPLERLVRDGTYFPVVRKGAAQCLVTLAQGDSSRLAALLDDIHSGAVADPDDELTGSLLTALYPQHISPSMILQYLHRPKKENFLGMYRHFWNNTLVRSTPKPDLPVLADGLSGALARLPGERWDYDRRRIASQVLAATLTAHGANASTQHLYEWLEVGIDKHGFAVLVDDEAAPIRAWLSNHPQTQKNLVAYGWSQVRPERETGRRMFWRNDGRLLRSTLPRDWCRWLLEQAASTEDIELARYCFDYAAHAAVNQVPHFEISIEDVEHWVARHSEKWPGAVSWLEQAWSVPLDHWQGEEAKRNAKYEAEQTAGRLERRRHIEKYLPALSENTAPPGLLMQIAYAYDKRFRDIRGETPQARVQDLLGGPSEEAEIAIQALERALERPDLPTVEEVLKLDLAQRHHFLRPACLIGAQLAFERNPSVIHAWSNVLAAQLAAFWLTEGLGETPSWYKALAGLRPTTVAPILVQYANQRIRKHPERNIEGLWLLGESEEQHVLAGLALPALLRAFPARATEHQLRVLNGQLLRAALRHLEPAAIEWEIKRRLKLKSLDAGQRIAWLTAGLSLDAVRYSERLVKFIGERQSFAAQLAAAIEQQESRRRAPTATPPRALGRLIELLAPHTKPDFPEGAGWVSDVDRRRDLLHAFVNELGAQGSDVAAKELQRLASLPALDRWRATIDGAIFSQRRLARDAAFRHPTAVEVAGVLANGPPANAMDLAALIAANLRDIEAHLRGDDLNGLRLFRRDDGKAAMVENDCRDVVARMLRDSLHKVGVLLETEARTTRDGRSDMRASFLAPSKRISVPIEIKKEDNRSLWSAWRLQLRELYALDPAASGVGIYLVLWLGIALTSGPNGERPTSPAALEHALNLHIPLEERDRLKAFVLDLSISPRPS